MTSNLQKEKEKKKEELLKNYWENRIEKPCFKDFSDYPLYYIEKLMKEDPKGEKKIEKYSLSQLRYLEFRHNLKFHNLPKYYLDDNHVARNLNE